ncbi:MAG TPA: hypothetical protein VD886_18695 [Herpetosiphonaceae bacterium]|nr:hypothetical protein [Herpetosiphonaceae bacterium]
MEARFRRRMVGLVWVVVVGALLTAGTLFWMNRTASGPGAVAIRYGQALDRHDLAAANALIAADSQPWDLNTPAERLGGRCASPAVVESSVTGTFAIVNLSCANRSSGPAYTMVQEDGVWKVVTLLAR